ncbi:MAG: hypothetical protein DI549_21250 [Ancylobacter novellus]|uniref:Uncharacterized protein n=1 Tax=Ancylobacter novellus TaxID=921 RepID=A0A2W5QVL3_ANCNO|nr:MAG: hypothetical protein DI549_21250 [Ancylobacter novellus]
MTLAPRVSTRRDWLGCRLTGTIRASLVGEGAAAIGVLSGEGIPSQAAATMVRDAPAWRDIRQNPPVLEFGRAVA